MTDRFSSAIEINATPLEVWQVLTDQKLMAAWMGEAAYNISISTNWEVGTPIVIRGYHHVAFENKGIVLEYQQGVKLSYTHLSSLSSLPDISSSYSIFDFTLTPSGQQTLLHFTIENFPTESIRKRLEFYWRTTVLLLKQCAEELVSK